MTAAWRNLQRLKLDFHAFVDRTRPHVHREAVAMAARIRHGIGFLARTTSRPSRARAAPRRGRQSTRSGQTDIYEQASELGRGTDAEPERDGAARSVGRGQYVLGFNLTGLGGVRVGLNYPRPLGVKKLECHHR